MVPQKPNSGKLKMKTTKIILASIILTIYILSIIGLTSALTITSVNTNPEVVAPGESSTIKIGVENDGNDNVEDVSVGLDLTNVPFAPYSSSSEISFDEIKENKVKYAEFEISALSEAKSGIYKIPLLISYKISGETQVNTKNSLIGISVNSKPIIDLGIEDGLLLKGQESKLSVKITNKGFSDVKFLEIEMQGGTSYTILSQKNVYIGDISSDDFDTADFNVFFKDTSASTANMPFTVRYKDSLNNKYEESFNLQAQVYTQKQAIDLGLIQKSNTTTYAGIVIGLIIIYIVYRNIKKRRKIKKAESSA
ncbi:MAG: hypothetical protein PHH54_05050 [Candidatus Nanoarchaeia archaeon]|nr:hypothetical protein [Candidatus Nanoarchaeia archaeon]MDD5741326.1 hypothetical protein [Candidatus Nanoarchaeia archaeon]